MSPAVPGAELTRTYCVWVVVIRISAGPVCAGEAQAVIPRTASPAATSRAAVLCIFFAPFAVLTFVDARRAHRQLHREHRPLTHFALEVDRPSVCFDDTSRQSEPEAAAGDSPPRGSAAEELREDPFVCLRWDAEPLVAHADPHDAILLLPRDLDGPPFGR